MQKSGIIAIVLIILLGAAAAAPYWFGMQAEEVYNKAMQEIVQDGMVVVSRQTYERGWLDSTAEATFTIGGIPNSLTVIHKIYHGPIPIEGDLDFNPVLALIKTQATLGKFPPINAKTTFQLDRQIISHFDVAGIAAGSAFSWQGLSVDMIISDDLKQSSMTLLAPLLKINTPTLKLTVANTKVETKLKQGASGLTTGSLSYSVDKLSSETDQGSLVMSGLALTTTTAEAGGNFGINVDIKLQSVSEGAATYGPGAVNIKVNNLDSATLAKYKKEIGALPAKKLPPDQLPSVMMGKMLTLVATLAKKTPEIDVSKINLKFKEGDITGSGKIVLDGSNPAIAENPGLLLTSLRGDGEIIVSRGALQALTALRLSRRMEALKSQGKFSEVELKKLTPQKITEISTETAPKYVQGFAKTARLVPDGDNYKMDLSLSRGQFLVNGQPL